MPRQAMTKMLPAVIKNQSRFDVSQPRRLPNIGSTLFWKVMVSNTKAMITNADMPKTRL